MTRLLRHRDCAQCGELFATPHAGTWPARFCSEGCHRISKGGTTGRPMRPAGRGFAVAPAQRAAVAGRPCIVCAAEPAEPAHLVDRSLVADLDDPRAVIPLGRHCHRLYDEGGLDLLPFLEPAYREHLAFAVERHGLLRTLLRVTNRQWTTRDEVS
jgi:hypothetical protein